MMPDSDRKYESILDKCSACYPISGEAMFCQPFRLKYKWETRGAGDLLMLSHPLHVKLLSTNNEDYVVVLYDFKYRSIDGELVGVLGNFWSLNTQPISVT